MELRYHKAALDDLELLVDTRIQVLRAANQLPGDTRCGHSPSVTIKTRFATEPISLIWSLTERNLPVRAASVFSR